MALSEQQAKPVVRSRTPLHPDLVSALDLRGPSQVLSIESLSILSRTGVWKFIDFSGPFGLPFMYNIGINLECVSPTEGNWSCSIDIRMRFIVWLRHLYASQKVSKHNASAVYLEPI